MRFIHRYTLFVALARTIHFIRYIRCTYGNFSRETTIHTVIYSADIQSWPTLIMFPVPPQGPAASSSGGKRRGGLSVLERPLPLSGGDQVCMCLCVCLCVCVRVCVCLCVWGGLYNLLCMPYITLSVLKRPCQCCCGGSTACLCWIGISWSVGGDRVCMCVCSCALVYVCTRIF